MATASVARVVLGAKIKLLVDNGYFQRAMRSGRVAETRVSCLVERGPWET